MKLQAILEGMGNGKLPTTITLTKIGKGKFNLALTFSQRKFAALDNKARKIHQRRIRGRRAGIYTSGNIICHQILDANGKQLHFKMYRMDELNGERRNAKHIENLKWNGKFKEASIVQAKNKRRTSNAASRMLSSIFNINKAYGVVDVVMEKPSHKTNRDFNNALLSFNKANIMSKVAEKPAISPSRLLEMVGRHCAKNAMDIHLVDGVFLQANAIFKSHDMSEAFRNACNDMLGRSTKNGHDHDLTICADLVPLNPSMLDWVRHLIHNKRRRQARLEVRKAFQARAVERAVRLVDNNRSAIVPKDEGRHPRASIPNKMG